MASLMLKAGYPAHTVAAWLGHDPKVLLTIYVHAKADDPRAAGHRYSAERFSRRGSPDPAPTVEVLNAHRRRSKPNLHHNVREVDAIGGRALVRASELDQFLMARHRSPPQEAAGASDGT